MQDVCLFAHFDSDDKVDDCVLRYIAKLRELNFSIVFISASRLALADIERLHGTCHDVMLRENAGLDFGSWSAGFAKHGSHIGGRLLLANDSVYGPIGDLRTALDRLTGRPADFYGMVESIQVAPHLQSWFLLFEQRVVRHTAFKAVLAQPFSMMTKKQIITRGEVGLSRRLVDAGFCYEALYLTRRSGLVARHYPFNPMQLLWRNLILDEGVPFLKVELIRDKPMALENATEVLQEVRRIDPTFCISIESHLSRVTKTTVGKPGANAFRSLMRRKLYALLRKGYRLNRDGRRAAELSTFIKLSPFLAVQRAWRVFDMLRDNGPDGP